MPDESDSNTTRVVVEDNIWHRAVKAALQEMLLRAPTNTERDDEASLSAARNAREH